MQLEERLYTSTEVADILGVSLRSIYRYLEEGKLDAEVKTATGRHRFTKQNILDFLYPKDTGTSAKVAPQPKQPVQVQPQVSQPEPQVTVEVADEEVADEEEPPISSENSVEEPAEEVDWLAKFRAAAERHRAELNEKKDEEVVETTLTADKESLSSLAGDDDDADLDKVEAMPQVVAKDVYYYKSGVGGLKEMAQYINKAARKSNVPYAFTMNAGMSLHKLIRPFSILHVYVHEADRDFFERALELTETDEANGQLALYISKNGVLDERKEVHALYVVSDLQLRKDLLDAGEIELAGELDEVLNL